MRPPPPPQGTAVSIPSRNLLLLKRLTQQQCHLRDITPPKMMDSDITPPKMADYDSAHLKKSTPSTPFPIIKTPPRDPKKDGFAVDDAASKESSPPRDHGDSSSGDSFDSDTDSGSSYTGSDSGTSISSKSRGHRRHREDRKKYHILPRAVVPKGQEPYSDSKSNAFSTSQVSFTNESLGTTISSKSRGHRRHREYRKKYYLEPDARVPKGQEPYFESYGGTPRPYVLDVPRGEPRFDPVTAAYQAGKDDAAGFSNVVKWLEAEEYIEP